MRWLPIGFCLAVSALFGACDRPDPTHGRAARVAPAQTPSPSLPVVAMERLVAERDHLSDAASTFSRVVQALPSRPYAVRTRGTFPSHEVSSSTLFTFGRSRVRGTCEHPPFTSAGTLCGDVVAPGAVLDSEERRIVTGLAEAAATRSNHEVSPARCFDPHHAIAYFDSGGAVVANVLVSFSCAAWSISPSTSENVAKPRAMLPHEQDALAKLFDGHGLAAWARRLVRHVPPFLVEHPPPTTLETEVDAYELATYGTEESPTPAGVERRGRRLMAGSGAPKEKPLRDLSAEQRRELCEWMTEEARPTRGPTSYGAGEHGYECDDGRRWISTRGGPACWTNKTECAHTVAEVESCLRVFREPDHLCTSPPRECAAVRECLPGFVRVH